MWGPQHHRPPCHSDRSPLPDPMGAPRWVCQPTGAILPRTHGGRNKCRSYGGGAKRIDQGLAAAIDVRTVCAR